MKQQIINHKSDCAIHNEPALPKGKCDCGIRKMFMSNHDEFIAQKEAIKYSNQFKNGDEQSFIAGFDRALRIVFDEN